MKIIIHGSEPETKEPEVRLKLVEVDDSTFVSVVDDAGQRVHGGLLVRFSRDGRICRCSGVGRDLGFALDDLNRVKFVDE